MPKLFDPQLVDQTVSPDELDSATADPGGEFQLVDTQDRIEGPDPHVARALFAAGLTAPASIPECLMNFRHMRDNHTPIGGVGLCLYDVRHFGWGVDALWPTANDAADHGAPVHRFKSFLDVPRGMTVVFTNDHFGHITVSLGGGLNNTSDFHENGYNGVATIANTAAWCGAKDWFAIEKVNGVDCWPDPHKPDPKPRPWGLAEHEREVHRALIRAKSNKAPKRRITGLKTWDDKMLARMKEHKIKRLPV